MAADENPDTRIVAQTAVLAQLVNRAPGTAENGGDLFRGGAFGKIGKVYRRHDTVSASTWSIEMILAASAI